MVGVSLEKAPNSFFNIQHFYLRQSIIIIFWAAALTSSKALSNPLSFIISCVAISMRHQLWFDDVEIRTDRAALPLGSQLSGLSLIAFDGARILEFVALYLLLIRVFLEDLLQRFDAFAFPLLPISVTFAIMCLLISAFGSVSRAHVSEEGMLRALWLYAMPSVFASYFVSQVAWR